MTDKQQLPERIWIDPQDSTFWNDTGNVKSLIPYARVQPVDEARVERLARETWDAICTEATRGGDKTSVEIIKSALVVFRDAAYTSEHHRGEESILRPLCAEHPHIGFVNGVLGGVHPLINKTRFSVSHLLWKLAIGMPVEEIKETWNLNDEMFRDAVAYAQDVLDIVIDQERTCVFPATGADEAERREAGK